MVELKITKEELGDILSGLGWIISELEGTTHFSTKDEKRVRDLIKKLQGAK